MVGKNNPKISAGGTVTRLNKRCPTRFTPTPHAGKKRNPSFKEPVEQPRDDYWSLPLPTSPAPSPPRPKELCERTKCDLGLGDPNETMIFTYRKLYNPHTDTTLRDALGREVAGRHRIPASEFSIRGTHRTPSMRAMDAHGILYWPKDTMPTIPEASKSGRRWHTASVMEWKPTVADRTVPRDAEVQRTANRPVYRRPHRLFADDVHGKDSADVDDGALVDRKEEEEDGDEADKTLEEITHQRDSPDFQKQPQSSSTATKTAQLTTPVSRSSRKRQRSKAVVRTRLYTGWSEARSDGIRTLTASEEGEEADDEAEEETNSGTKGTVSSDKMDTRRTIASGEEEEHAPTRRNHRIPSTPANDSEEEDQEQEKRVVSVDKQMKVDDASMRRGSGSQTKKRAVTDRISAQAVEMESEEEGEDPARKTSRKQEGAGDGDASMGDEEKEKGEDFSFSHHPLFDQTLLLSCIDPTIRDAALRDLLSLCNQTTLADWPEILSGVISVKKVAEGSFGEIFLIRREWHPKERILKVLVIEKNKTGEFLGEVVISRELTRLRTTKSRCESFTRFWQAKVIQGQFPKQLEEPWRRFKEERPAEEAQNNWESEWKNEAQLYLCLEMDNSGEEIPKYKFSCVSEILSVFAQTALAIAVAESEIRFEHRDLHEQNVLVKKVPDEMIWFCFDREKEDGREGREHVMRGMRSHAVHATIIDYTLSRMTKNETEIFNDIRDDICDQPGSPGSQGSLYGKMRKLVRRRWSLFVPQTNCWWLNMLLRWVLKEMLDSVKLVNDLKNEKEWMAELPEEEKDAAAAAAAAIAARQKWLRQIKKRKEQELIRKMNAFARRINKYESAASLVSSSDFSELLSLLE